MRLVYGPVAQLVEQGTENPCVARSIRAWATKYIKKCTPFCKM